MVCVCGAVLPVDNRVSICNACLNLHDEDYDDGMDGDWGSGMSSAGWGTDEDYGYYGDE